MMNPLVTEFCRTCLAFDDVTLRPLRDSPLKKTLSFLLGVEVKKDDISSFICRECKALLWKYHRFRARCLRTQKLLRVLANERGEVEPVKANYLRKIRLESRLHSALVEDHLVTGADLHICSHQHHQSSLPSVADDHCYVPLSASQKSSVGGGAKKTYSDVNSTSSSGKVAFSEERRRENSKVDSDLQVCRSAERNVTSDPKLAEVVPRISVLRSYLPSRKSVSLIAKSGAAMKTSMATMTRATSVSQELRNQITRLIETDGKWDGTQQCEDVKSDKEDSEPKSSNEEPSLALEPDIRSQLLESAFATETILSPEEQLQEMEERGRMKSYLKARFKCTLCLTGFQRDDKYRTHFATVHDVSIGEYVCEMCHFRFNRSIKLKNHLASAHLKRYQCLRCPHRSKTQYMARLHGIWHSRANYPCRICDRIFESVRAVQRHAYTAHEQDSGSRSRASSVNFSDARISTTNHFNARPSPHPCPRCPAVLTGSRALDAHLRAAHGERRVDKEGRKYMCEVCGEGCMSLGSLRSHLLRHTRDKPYKCEQCDSSFATGWRLRQHERRHSGDRPFPCSVCAKRFITKTHLNRHLRIHTGLKPYVCMYCGRAFVQSTTMRDHIKMVHFKMRRRRAPKKKAKKEEVVANEQNVNVEQTVVDERNVEIELNVEYEQGVENQSVEYIENVEYLENDENVETEIVYSYNSDYVLNTI